MPTPQGLARVGPGAVSKLVRVQVRELSWTDKSGGLALRWEATGAGGKVFPVLDADLTLVDFGARGTLVALAGVYRPPLGVLGQALDRAGLHRVAVATIRGFLTRVAAQLALPYGGAVNSGPVRPLSSSQEDAEEQRGQRAEPGERAEDRAAPGRPGPDVQGGGDPGDHHDHELDDQRGPVAGARG